MTVNDFNVNSDEGFKIQLSNDGQYNSTWYGQMVELFTPDTSPVYYLKTNYFTPGIEFEFLIPHGVMAVTNAICTIRAVLTFNSGSTSYVSIQFKYDTSTSSWYIRFYSYFPGHTTVYGSYTQISFDTPYRVKLFWDVTDVISPYYVNSHAGIWNTVTKALVASYSDTQLTSNDVPLQMGAYFIVNYNNMKNTDFLEIWVRKMYFIVAGDDYLTYVNQYPAIISNVFSFPRKIYSSYYGLNDFQDVYRRLTIQEYIAETLEIISTPGTGVTHIDPSPTSNQMSDYMNSGLISIASNIISNITFPTENFKLPAPFGGLNSFVNNLFVLLNTSFDLLGTAVLTGLSSTIKQLGLVADVTHEALANVVADKMSYFLNTWLDSSGVKSTIKLYAESQTKNFLTWVKDIVKVEHSGGYYDVGGTLQIVINEINTQYPGLLDNLKGRRTRIFPLQLLNEAVLFIPKEVSFKLFGNSTGWSCNLEDLLCAVTGLYQYKDNKFWLSEYWPYDLSDPVERTRSFNYAGDGFTIKEALGDLSESGAWSGLAYVIGRLFSVSFAINLIWKLFNKSMKEPSNRKVLESYGFNYDSNWNVIGDDFMDLFNQVISKVNLIQDNDLISLIKTKTDTIQDNNLIAQIQSDTNLIPDIKNKTDSIEDNDLISDIKNKTDLIMDNDLISSIKDTSELTHTDVKKSYKRLYFNTKKTVNEIHSISNELVDTLLSAVPSSLSIDIMTDLIDDLDLDLGDKSLSESNDYLSEWVIYLDEFEQWLTNPFGNSRPIRPSS
jgi:hypothetical protein